MPDLTGRVAAITGGGKGLGRALAVGLARRGARIAITGRRANTLSETAGQIEMETGNEVLHVAIDVSNPEAVRSFATKVHEVMGGAQILINNAAGWLEGTLLDADDSEIHATIDTTIKGPIWLCREFWPQLMEGNPGQILNITTLDSRPNRSNATPIYIAAKAGLAGFTEALRRLAIKDGIQVTELLPGSVASEFGIDATCEEVSGRHGNRRVTPQDIVDSVVFVLTRAPFSMIEELRIPSAGDWFEDFGRY